MPGIGCGLQSPKLFPLPSSQFEFAAEKDQGDSFSKSQNTQKAKMIAKPMRMQAKS